MTCPLCTNSLVTPYASDRKRDYWQCERCDLVYVPFEQRLSSQQEKAEYDLHQNSPDDQGYRQFLNRLLEPLTKRLAANAQGLDFGCGPGPALSVIMAEQGFSVENYDIFYAKNDQLLKRQYDFITCTEVLEHIYQPNITFDTFNNMLKNSGILAIMTKRVIDKKAFTTWHYKNDPTHVCFYSERTFRWIAQRHGFDIEFPGKDSVLLFKQ